MELQTTIKKIKIESCTWIVEIIAKKKIIIKKTINWLENTTSK